jgi:hypothetical protein
MSAQQSNRLLDEVSITFRVKPPEYVEVRDSFSFAAGLLVPLQLFKQGLAMKTKIWMMAVHPDGSEMTIKEENFSIPDEIIRTHWARVDSEVQDFVFVFRNIVCKVAPSMNRGFCVCVGIEILAKDEQRRVVTVKSDIIGVVLKGLAVIWYPRTEARKSKFKSCSRYRG